MKNIAVMVIGVGAMLGMLFFSFIVGYDAGEASVDRKWNCRAEDEVVVIDDSCRHIDELPR